MPFIFMRPGRVCCLRLLYKTNGGSNGPILESINREIYRPRRNLAEPRCSKLPNTHAMPLAPPVHCCLSFCLFGGTCRRRACLFYESDRDLKNCPVKNNCGPNPSTTSLFERSFHLSFSRWFYRTRPALTKHLQLTPPKERTRGTGGLRSGSSGRNTMMMVRILFTLLKRLSSRSMCTIGDESRLPHRYRLKIPATIRCQYV